LQTTSALLAGAWGAALARADELPEVTNPRATRGDAVGPDWQERLTITVGPEKADLVGNDERVIQAAVDYLARRGGGTVQLLPGTYRMRNAVSLQSNIRLLGSGADSVLVKEPSVSCKIIADSDHYDQEITLADPKGFRVGDGITLIAKDAHSNGRNYFQGTLVARSGNRFKLDRPLQKNFWVVGDAKAGTIFPLLLCRSVAEVTIESVTLDGNKTNNENLHPQEWEGCISLSESNRITIRQVTARNENGDGMVWEYSHDVLVENCHSHDHVYFGLHLGSGSQRSILRGNQLRNNDIGIYYCWGAKYGLATKNVIEDSRRYGISVGHCDTDNLIRDNDVRRNGQTGILLSGGDNDAPHRTRLERNRIVDSGSEKGIAIDVQGGTASTTLSQNELRETRQPLSRIGIRIGPQTRDIRCIDNQVEGFATAVLDLHKT